MADPNGFLLLQKRFKNCITDGFSHSAQLYFGS